MDPVVALRELGAVATFGELMGKTTKRRLATAVAAGQVHRLRHNAYCLADLAGVRRQAARIGGVVSHLSAAQEHGWKVKHDPIRPCITLPRNARKPAGEYELHWSDLPEGDVHRLVTSRVRTVVDCARAYDFDVALSVADSALREGVIDQDDLLVAAATSPRTGRRRTMRIAEAASAKRANPFETCLFAIADQVEGLSVHPQGDVPGVGFVDLLDPRLGIVIEAESFAFHSSRRELRRDASRYTACARLGLVVLRFTWDQVMFEPDEVRAAIEDVVRWRTLQAVHGHGLAS